MSIKKLGLAFVKNYLKLIVGILLKIKKPEIVVVTGTAGKTTTKETIYAVLHEKFKDQIARTHGSLSTKTGVPIGMLGFSPKWDDLGPPWWHWPGWVVVATIRTLVYLLGIKPYPRLWIVEFAADLPGDFYFLLSYVHPSISVVTNVGAGHTEFFGSPQAVAKEKSAVIANLPPDGVAILNYNDDLVRQMAKQTKAKVLWVRSKGISFAPAAARIIGRLYDMGYDEIEKGLKQVKLPAGRMDIFNGRQGVVVIDSTYNANPVSMTASLDVLAQYPRKSVRDSRKIAVLGEMLELGNLSEVAHKKVYEQARLVADEIFTIGAGFNGVAKINYRDFKEAIQLILPQLKAGDIILVKGSRGVHLERLTQVLKP